MILLCIFIAPLYFLLRKKWVHFAISAVLYGIACLLALSLILIWLAPFFWLPTVLHAVWQYSRRAQEEHAEMLATKMAEKMRDQNVPPVIPTGR